MPASAELDDDLVAPEAVQDPYALFARLRASSPVHWSGRHKAWILTRYGDVLAGLTDDRLSTDNIRPLEGRMEAGARERFAPAARLLQSWMLFNDPPVHTHLRAPVRNAFTPKAVERLRRPLQATVDRLLDNVESLGTCDLVAEFAFPLPASAIAALLGVPEGDLEQFRSWSHHLSALVLGKVDDGKAWDRALQAERGFSSLFERLIERYERKPGPNLITALIEARDAGQTLDPAQMVGACTLLLFAGHETTTNLIASSALNLLRRPEEQDRLRANPALMETAVEEMVRFDGPAKVVVRRVRTEHELEGHRFAVGQPVFLAVAGANRDPEVFPDPDRFDVARDPNRHVGFGWGRHFCLGAQLARLETQLAIGALIERFPALRLDDSAGEPQWQPNIVGRSLRRLRVAVR